MHARIIQSLDKTVMETQCATLAVVIVILLFNRPTSVLVKFGPYAMSISWPDVYNFKRMKNFSKDSDNREPCVNYHWNFPSAYLFQMEPRLILWRCTSFLLLYAHGCGSLLHVKRCIISNLFRAAVQLLSHIYSIEHCWSNIWTVVCLKASWDHLSCEVLGRLFTPHQSSLFYTHFNQKSLHQGLLALVQTKQCRYIETYDSSVRSLKLFFSFFSSLKIYKKHGCGSFIR